MNAKKKLKPLDPPDLERCQAEKPNGASFMTLGGRPGRVRCSSAPIVIATEKKPGPDGRKGSMSLCGSCKTVLEKQRPDYAVFTPIRKRKWEVRITETLVRTAIVEVEAKDWGEARGKARVANVIEYSDAEARLEPDPIREHAPIRVDQGGFYTKDVTGRGLYVFTSPYGTVLTGDDVLACRAAVALAVGQPIHSAWNGEGSSTLSVVAGTEATPERWAEIQRELDARWEAQGRP